MELLSLRTMFVRDCQRLVQLKVSADIDLKYQKLENDTVLSTILRTLFAQR